MNGARRRLRRLRRLRRVGRLRGRGVLLIPTSFTVANIFCGFSAIIQAANGNYRVSAVLILVAAVLDGLDGRIARLTRSASEFGLQFDSIADTISFGVAPAYVLYIWGVEPLQRIGWAVSFLYVFCASARLARFNIQHAVSDNRYFIGLPTPPAAIALASVVLFHDGPLVGRPEAWVAAVLLSGLSLLMISRIRYRSFKDLDMRSGRAYGAMLVMAAAGTAVLVAPALALVGLSFLYVASGPFALLFRGRRRRRPEDRAPRSPLVAPETEPSVPAGGAFDIAGGPLGRG